MSGLFRFIFYDFKRKWGAPFTILIYLSLPIILSLLMGSIFGGKKSVKFSPPKVALVNNDNGFLSEAFVRFLTDERMKKEFDFVLTDLKKGEKGMRNQEYSAIVLIPAEFTDRFFNKKCPELVVIENPSQGIYPKMVKTMFSLFTEGLNYLLTYYGNQFDQVSVVYKTLKNRDLSGLLSLNFSALKDIGGDFIKKTKVLYGEVKNRSFKIDFVKVESEKKASFVSIFFPAYALFFLLFFANLSAVSIVRENGERITERLFLTKMSGLKYLFAKVVSSFVFLFSISFVFALCGFFIFGLKTNAILSLIVVIAIGCLSVFSVFFLVSSFAKRKESASNLGMVVLFLMGFTGGGMIPLSLLPSPVVSVSSFFPFYRINILLVSLLEKNILKTDYLLFCIVFALLCFSLGFLNFKKRLRKG